MRLFIAHYGEKMRLSEKQDTNQAQQSPDCRFARTRPAFLPMLKENAIESPFPQIKKKMFGKLFKGLNSVYYPMKVQLLPILSLMDKSTAIKCC